MAHPFGGLPSLAAYIDWVRKQGGSAQTGMRRHKGKIYTLTRIELNGKHVPVVDIKQNEGIGGSYIAYLDRRLGVTSPWSDLPGYA